jgi:hypothetical protein
MQAHFPRGWFFCHAEPSPAAKHLAFFSAEASNLAQDLRLQSSALTGTIKPTGNLGWRQ